MSPKNVLLLLLLLAVHAEFNKALSKTLDNPKKASWSPLQSSTGKMFLIGGALKDTTASIFEAMKSATNKAEPVIAVAISGAASLQDGTDAYNVSLPGDKSYQKLFTDNGFKPVLIELALDNYLTASSGNTTLGTNNIQLITTADIVFFNGGDQSRHSRSWLNADGSDSDILKALRGRFAEGLVIAGTSAGAAVQSNPSYGEGYSYGYYYFNADLKPCNIGNTLRDDREGTSSFRYSENGGMMTGLEFVRDVLVDTHFDARGRFVRMAAAMRNARKPFGFGVGEDTALYVNGDMATVYGNDGVWIMDSSDATFPSGTYFAVNDIKISYLTEGDSYKFSTKELTSTKELITDTDTSDKAYESDDVLFEDEGIRSIKSLVVSNSSRSVGYSSELRPTCRVVFNKGLGEISYKTGQNYTVDKMIMDIGTL